MVAFEEALAKTFSPKEQKQHMRNLLLLATGTKLKALAAQKSVNVITNVSSSKHNSHSTVVLFLSLHFDYFVLWWLFWILDYPFESKRHI